MPKINIHSPFRTLPISKKVPKDPDPSQRIGKYVSLIGIEMEGLPYRFKTTKYVGIDDKGFYLFQEYYFTMTNEKVLVDKVDSISTECSEFELTHAYDYPYGMPKEDLIMKLTKHHTWYLNLPKSPQII